MLYTIQELESPTYREQEAYKCDLKIFVYFLTSAVEVSFFIEIYKKVTCIVMNPTPVIRGWACGAALTLLR